MVRAKTITRKDSKRMRDLTYGIQQSNSGSSSSDFNGSYDVKSNRSFQGLNTFLTLPGTSSFRQDTWQENISKFSVSQRIDNRSIDYVYFPCI